MSADDSVSQWIDRLQEPGGDPSAVRLLWSRYFPRLVALARDKLRSAPRLGADEEDVALSAFDSFCRAAGNGRFPDLFDRDGLWRLLVALTARKAAHLLRDQSRLKRGGAHTPGGAEELEGVIDREPTPEFAAEVAEQCRALLARLGDPTLEAVAVKRMEGYSVEEIAAELGCAERSVKRKLALIRDIWSEDPA